MPKDCFVVGPIGAADSAVRVHADWLLEEIINPVMQDYPEFVVHRADKLSQPGLIDTQVITHLLNDDLVIADITTLNPNAFYEIGIRHMAQRPIIHMHKIGEKIPFDISAFRSIEFSLERPNDLRDARVRLKNAVDAVMADGFRVDNPVTHARGVVQLHEEATDLQRVLLDEIDGIKERLNMLDTMAANSVFGRLAEHRTEVSKTMPWENNPVDAKSAIASLFGEQSTDNLSSALSRIAEIAADQKKLKR